MKRNNKSLAPSLIFLMVGLVFTFLLGFAFLSNTIKVINSTEEILSYKTEIEVKVHTESVTYYKKYFYIVDGKEYSCESLNGSSTKPSESNQIIHYDPDSPSTCIIDSLYQIDWFILPLMLLPLLFIFFGYLGISSVIDNNKTYKRLCKYGVLYKKQTFIIDYLEPEMEVLGKGAGVVRVDLQLPNEKVYHLESGIIKVSNALLEGGIDVLIDIKKPSNYYIDFNINIDDFK